MKTTLELPDGLMKRVKLRAIHRNLKLKDAIAQLLEIGMAASQPDGPSHAPTPVRLKSARRMTIDDVEMAIGAGRE